jgi:hypothetical protein
LFGPVIDLIGTDYPALIYLRIRFDCGLKCTVVD